MTNLSSFRSGVLQPGDRVLAVNGQQLEGMTLEDARSVIKESNNQIHLEIEFDVAGRGKRIDPCDAGGFSSDVPAAHHPRQLIVYVGVQHTA